MGRKTAFALSLAALTLFAAPSNLFAAWCTSTVDACCDGHSAHDYTLPEATSQINYYYNGSADKRVEFLLYDVTGGGETLLVSTFSGACD